MGIHSLPVLTWSEKTFDTMNLVLMNTVMKEARIDWSLLEHRGYQSYI